jgi:hypothetical protein
VLRKDEQPSIRKMVAAILVIPAQAGIQSIQVVKKADALDPRLRGDDEMRA